MAVFVILKILSEPTHLGFEIVIFRFEFFDGIDHGEIDGGRVETVITILGFVHCFWEMRLHVLRQQADIFLV